MPTAKINGIDINFERHGEAGEPLVFIHGFTGDISDWRFQAEPFGRTNQLLVFDNRGHGASEAPKDRSTYSIEQMASDAEALIAEVGFERYHLLGHSMGGAIAQEIALRSQGRLLSLALEDTAPLFEISKNEMLSKLSAARNTIAETQGMGALAKWKSPLPSPPHMPKEREAEVAARLSHMSVDAFIGAQAGLNDWKGSLDRLASIVVPALVVVGSLDFGPLVGAARLMADKVRNGTLEVIPEAGHSPQYERPELFNAVLRRHLDSATAVSSAK
ncbi:MAG: alpha/beta hydrolase [Chloroflexota bacterium]